MFGFGRGITYGIYVWFKCSVQQAYLLLLPLLPCSTLCESVKLVLPMQFSIVSIGLVQFFDKPMDHDVSHVSAPQVVASGVS